jgi:hypothetical protein
MRAHRLSIPVLALGLCVLGGSPADADVIGADDPPAHITFEDGDVWLDREGESHRAVIGLPVLPGDRLRSTVGRIEILFPDGSVLHLDDGTSVELLSPGLLRLTSGRVRLDVVPPGGLPGAASFEVETPEASAVLEGAGEYRVALVDRGSGPETELAVARGWARLLTSSGDVSMRAGEIAFARAGEPPSRPSPFDAAAFDTFDLWSMARRDARGGRPGFSAHLPRELHMYGGILDRDGNWHHEPGYGYVWYPSVPVDWRPYSHGYWDDLPVYGWTWIGANTWHWPTHHYGRWAHARSRWFWVPGRTWRAAWVHWAAAPGYVAWSPWGLAAGHGTFGFSFSFGHPGWVVAPRASFGRRGPTHWVRTQPRAFTAEARFVVQDDPPVPHVARGTRVAAEPVRRVAVPRAPAAARASAPPPRAAWSAPRATARPAESPRRSEPDRTAPTAVGAADPPAAQTPPAARQAPPARSWSPRSRAVPPSEAPAVRQAPPAESGGRASRARAVPRSSAPAAVREAPPPGRGTSPGGRGASARAASGGGGGGEAAAAQPAPRRAAPAGASSAPRSRARR